MQYILQALSGILALGVCVSAAHAAGDPMLELVATIPLPNVKGRIDHLAIDLKGNRLYVAALGNDTVEVVNTAQNRHEKSLAGFGEPQGVVYVPAAQRLYIGNGTAGRVDILDGASLTVVRQIPKFDDADNVRYDAATKSVIVGYGKGALHFFDLQTGDSKGDIRLSGHPESFQLEQNGSRVFVNVPTAHHIAVVDRTKRAVIATWDVSARSNYPMALDEKGKRLFVGARSPAVILVHDLDSGKETSRLKIAGDTDDLFFDAQRKRLYAVCGEGQVDIFTQESPDRYVHAGSVKTAARARTGLFVPEQGRLYVAAPAASGSEARILVLMVK